MSSYGSILKWLRKHFRSVSTSEYLPSGELGRLVNGTLNQGIQKLTFEDDSFDILTSNQVFEHVPDDRAGYRESYRVLRPGGALIFSVPLYDTPLRSALREFGMGQWSLWVTPSFMIPELMDHCQLRSSAVLHA